MNILVTGGAGGIGSTLAIELSKQGHTVVALDDFSHGYMANLTEDGQQVCDVVALDIRETDKLKQLLDSNATEVIVHLAALTSLPECESNPSECIDVNVAGTASVLTAARLAKTRRVIVASTSAIYENNDKMDAPFKEKLDVEPRLFYPLSKKLMEETVQSYIDNYNMDVVTLRFFNVFGPRQDIGRQSPPLINYIVREVANKRPLTFYSTGRQQRDYVHVDDVVDLINRCLEDDRAKGGVFNVCTGTLTSVRDIIGYAEKAFGKLDYEFKESGKFWSGYNVLFEGMPLSEEVIKNEVNKFSLGSNAEAFWKLGWKPKTNIEELMIDTMKKNYELITK